MNKEQLGKIEQWFDGFVAGFYCGDEYVNANIKLKEDHSRRVCDEILFLAEELGLDENKRLLAETIGLLHDAGRFPQGRQGTQRIFLRHGLTPLFATLRRGRLLLLGLVFSTNPAF
jgi:hypothetical protein